MPDDCASLDRLDDLDPGGVERDLLAGLAMADLIDTGADRGLDVLAMKRVGKFLPGRPLADHFYSFKLAKKFRRLRIGAGHIVKAV